MISHHVSFDLYMVLPYFLLHTDNTVSTQQGHLLIVLLTDSALYLYIIIHFQEAISKYNPIYLNIP